MGLALALLFVAVIAGVLGFGDVTASNAAWIAQIVFFVAISGTVLSFFVHRRSHRL